MGKMKDKMIAEAEYQRLKSCTEYASYACAGHAAYSDELEKRMDIVGQNGNDGNHYSSVKIDPARLIADIFDWVDLASIPLHIKEDMVQYLVDRGWTEHAETGAWYPGE